MEGDGVREREAASYLYLSLDPTDSPGSHCALRSVCVKNREV